MNLDFLNNKNILVTGGTGSFGKRFIKNVLENSNPNKLIIFSRDELKQYEMQLDPTFNQRPNLRYFIGDIRDCDRLEMAMRDVDYVIHTAALKQVTAAEYNPFECINTNVHGAENIVRASLRTNVKKVIALSTDKAVNPINLYGASKLASDKIFIAANNLSGNEGCNYSVVRYGNVLGSRGSVIPLFYNILKSGNKTLPITDPRMTRFWITLDKGVEFVLSSLEKMEGGEIFIPKIPSMNITDLAKAICPDAKLENIGIRPGEKLHETLIIEDDSRGTFELPDSYIVCFNLFPEIKIPKYLEGNLVKVEEGFRYASDNNTEWASIDDIKTILESEFPNRID